MDRDVSGDRNPVRGPELRPNERDRIRSGLSGAFQDFPRSSADFGISRVPAPWVSAWLECDECDEATWRACRAPPLGDVSMLSFQSRMPGFQSRTLGIETFGIFGIFGIWE